jgi:hypothetical protein
MADAMIDKALAEATVQSGGRSRKAAGQKSPQR